MQTSAWNAVALSGGDERKSKFLRLLGAGKSKEIETPSQTSPVFLAKAERELEKQYEAGVRMKHDLGGRRKGLGAW